MSVQQTLTWNSFYLSTIKLTENYNPPQKSVPTLGIFRAQNDRLVVGYLMGAEILEFRPTFGPWQLFKEGNRQSILADFATPYLKTP